MTWQRLVCCVAVGFGALVASSVHAVDLSWDNPATTGPLFFNDAANWTPAQTPTAADNLLFQIDQGANPIILNAGSLSNDLSVSENIWVLTGAASGDLTTTGVGLIDGVTATSLLDAPRLELINNAQWNLADAASTSDNDLIVGQQGVGELRILSGADVATEELRIGDGVDSLGLILVDGAVGSGAPATLTATRTDTSGGVMTIGVNGGDGTLNLVNGGQLLTTGVGFSANQDIVIGFGLFDADLGDPANPVVRSTGVLNVQGAGSFAETSDLLVGHAGGIGSLNITSGGQVLLTDGESPVVFFGNGADSVGNGLVTGSGSTLLAHSIHVGRSGGTGRLAIADVAELRTEITAQAIDTDEGDTFLGSSNGSGGEVSEGILAVYGNQGNSISTFDNANNLFVGVEGRGELRIGRDLDGNEVGSGIVNANNLIIASELGNSLDNRVVIEGAQTILNLGGNVIVGEEGTGTFEALDGATLNIAGGVQVGLSPGANGTALFDDVEFEADDFFIGNATGAGGVGVVTVRNGASVELRAPTSVNGSGQETNDAVSLGDDGAGHGTLNIEGANSVVETTVGGWFIGGSGNEDGGTGLANLTSGGVGISNDRVVLGYRAGSQGTLNIDGAGSRFDANGDLVLVGFFGTADVAITDGGTLNANGMFVADGNTSTGSSVTVDGAGSTINLQHRLHVGDSAVGSMTISGGAQVNVALDSTASAINQRLIVGTENAADGSSLTITGAGSRLDYHGTENIRIGFFGGSTSNRATVRVENGGVLSAVQRNPDNSIASQGSLFIGDENNGNGRLVVTGAGSLVEAFTLDLGQGNNASGTLLVADGGRLSLTSNIEIGDMGTSSVTNLLEATGANSRVEAGTELTIGAQGGVRGTLSVRDGAVVTNGTDAFIGLANGTTATAVVGGVDPNLDARWEIGGDLYIAGNRDLGSTGSFTSGSGTLNIEENGTVSVAGFAILKDRGTINLNGGTFIADNLRFQNVAAGSDPTFNWNSGTLRYSEGKTLGTTDASFLFPGGPAVLDAGKHVAFDGILVLSEEIRLNGGELSINSIAPTNYRSHVDFDAGTLNLTGSSVVVTGNGPFGNVAVIDQDQTLNVTNALFVQSDGLLSVAGGTVTMGTGVIVAGGTLVVADGTVDFGSQLNNEGDVVLIDATTSGTLANSADLTLVNTVLGESFINTAAGTLSLGLGTAGSDDLLQLTGDATLAGTLDVSLDDPAGITFGDEIDLILADTVTGTFDNTLLPTLGAGLAFDMLYEADRVALQVVLAGDYNGNGIVDAADFTVWRDGNSPDSSIAGYQLWANNFGATAPSAASNFAGQPVPEPATALLLLAGSIVAAVGIRRR